MKGETVLSAQSLLQLSRVKKIGWLSRNQNIALELHCVVYQWNQHCDQHL